MRTAGLIIAGAYIAERPGCLGLAFTPPPHGYRAGWSAIFYAGTAIEDRRPHQSWPGRRKGSERLTPPRATSDFAGGARHRRPVRRDARLEVAVPAGRAADQHGRVRRRPRSARPRSASRQVW